MKTDNKQTGPAYISALNRVPRILKIMREAGFITEQSQEDDILNAQEKNPRYKGMFAGDIAVAMGIITAAQKDRAVGQQAIQIAAAAAADVSHLKNPQLDIGNAYWGNNGQPNRPINNPTINDAASVLANVAKLITQLASKNISSMNQTQIRSAHLAVRLVNSMFKPAQGTHVFVGKISDVQIVFAALKEVAKIADVPTDTVKTYISHRSFEVFYGFLTPLAYAPPVILAFASGTILSSLAVGAGCALVVGAALIGKDHLGPQVSHCLNYTLIYSQQFVDMVGLPCVGERVIA